MQWTQNRESATQYSIVNSRSHVTLFPIYILVETMNTFRAIKID